MNRSKQGRYGKKTIVVLLFGLILGSARFAEAQQPRSTESVSLLQAAHGTR